MSQKPKKTLELPKELNDKLEQKIAEREQSKTTDEWRIIATIGLDYGWQAVKSLLGIGCEIHGDGGKDCECISWDTAEELIKASTSIKAKEKIDMINIMTTTNIASNSKNPEKVVRNLLNYYKDRV